MALEGQLSDFSLEEILQLISVQQKSGFLVLKHEREMVFYFERGALISTRDRRNPDDDPLEAYLRRYGFLTPEQWTHVDYVLQHATLDLTEVLVSEHLLDERVLGAVLQALAQEQVHEGMKLKRGRYHFTATPDVTSGIRGRIAMDVQGLLMEGARRLDEEPRLLEKLPSPNLTFRRGPKPPQPGELGETSARLLRLALAGRTLGEIVAQGRTCAFTARELLANLCNTGVLEPVQSTLAEVIPLPVARQATAAGRAALRQPALVALLAVALLAAGWARWRPALAGAAPPPAAAAASAAPTGGEAIRLAQLRDDVEQAIVLYHRQHDSYPTGLVSLVENGFLDPSVPRALEGRGWGYRLVDRGRGYLLGP